VNEKVSTYFTKVSDSRVHGHCLHLLSAILNGIGCTYLTGDEKNIKDLMWLP
jgi:hypothetical protein